MLVLDIEASGTNASKHSIVSLGALDLNNPSDQLYLECRIWQGAHSDPEALAVNGFTEAEINDPNKMTEEELLRNFIGWAMTLSDQTLAGQNVSFDRDFIQAACLRNREPFPFAHRMLDTHTMAYTHMVERGVSPPFDSKHHRSALNLDQVLRYCGIPEEPQPHNALTGAKCHAEVISRLLFGKKLLPEFKALPIPFTALA